MGRYYIGIEFVAYSKGTTPFNTKEQKKLVIRMISCLDEKPDKHEITLYWIKLIYYKSFDNEKEALDWARGIQKYILKEFKNEILPSEKGIEVL